ncbi:hypothetical protein AAXB25_33470 [Paenibacillus lautus]|uniref:hypothetical protein n=1 Tax=Paenibacillus lautus TaxID=1401 RepID=UPI003D2C7E2B
MINRINKWILGSLAALVLFIGLFNTAGTVEAVSGGAKAAKEIAQNQQQSTGDGESAEEEGEEGDKGGWLIPDFVYDLLQKIDDLMQTFKDLMSGKLIKDAIEGFIVMSIDEAMSPLYDAFSKGYLFTPHIAEIDSVQKGWSIFMILGMASLFLAILWLTIRVISGKKDLKSLLKVFLVCFIVTYFSLTILNILNVGVNWFSQEMIQGILGTKDIQYQGLDGQQVLKALIVGVDGITDPTYSGQTLGQVVVETPGGLFTLIMYTLLNVFPLYLIVLFKQLLLIGLAIFVCVWISYTAFTGKYETLIGFFNLYTRSVLVGLFCSLHWSVFVQQQTQWSKGEGFLSALGIPPIFMAIVSGLLLIVFFYFFWIKPVFKAVNKPLTLNGADAVGKIGEWGLKGSSALSNLGKRMGSEGMQKKAMDWSKASENIKDAGERLRNQRSVSLQSMASSMTGGVSESLQGVQYSEPERWLEESGNITVTEDYEVELGASEIKSSGLNIYKTLSDKGFETGKLLHVPDQERSLMTEQLKTLKEEYKDDVVWNEQTGHLFLKGETPSMVDKLKEVGFDTSNVHDGVGRDGLIVDLDTKQALKIQDTKKSQQALETVEEELPVYTETKLSPDLAQKAYNQLTNRDEYEWSSDLLMENNKLWIPKEHEEEINEVLEEMISEKREKPRYDFPRHSQFAKEMIDEWKQSHLAWADKIEVAADQSHVYIPEEHKDDFEKHYEAYRKGKVPFWQAKNGKVYVIKDGVPVDHGQPPINGLDMGSFEKFKAEMLHQHNKKNAAANTSNKK